MSEWTCNKWKKEVYKEDKMKRFLCLSHPTGRRRRYKEGFLLKMRSGFGGGQEKGREGGREGEKGMGKRENESSRCVSLRVWHRFSARSL